MASELREEKNESTDRKLNIATILAGITGIGCLAVCALVSGSISFELSTSVWGKMVGILSIIGGMVKFVNMGVFVERIAKRSHDIDDEDENFVKNTLDVARGVIFLLSGIINFRLGVVDSIRKLGIVAISLGGIDTLISCCSLVTPIVSKGQIDSNIKKNNLIPSEANKNEKLPEVDSKKDIQLTINFIVSSSEKLACQAKPIQSTQQIQQENINLISEIDKQF